MKYSEEAYDHIEQLNGDINQYLKHQSLITCFSFENDLLSQWRAYGQDGEGMAIGFDFAYLKRLFEGQKEILIDKVSYKEKEQKGLLEESCLYLL